MNKNIQRPTEPIKNLDASQVTSDENQSQFRDQ